MTRHREMGVPCATIVLAMTAILLSGCCVPPREVTHVVVCRLKEPGNEEHRHALIDESIRLAMIPGVKRVAAGPPLAGANARPVVDSSYDVLIVMTFRNQGALRAYEQHPRHQQAVEQVLKPLVASYVIHDARTANSR